MFNAGPSMAVMHERKYIWMQFEGACPLLHGAGMHACLPHVHAVLKLPSAAQVDDCIAKYQWMAQMTKQVAERKRAGQPIPRSAEELEGLLGQPIPAVHICMDRHCSGSCSMPAERLVAIYNAAVMDFLEGFVCVLDMCGGAEHMVLVNAL